MLLILEIQVKETKDKVIKKDLINNKHGYDFFNTIFFERHREILLRSSRKWAGISLVIYVLFTYLVRPLPSKVFLKQSHLHEVVALTFFFFFLQSKVLKYSHLHEVNSFIAKPKQKTIHIHNSLSFSLILLYRECVQPNQTTNIC